jgi:CheY-like chemotaxis protein
MESLGQLTGGLAHDFNNLLMAILGCLNSLAKTSGHDPAALRFVEAARGSAERGAALTRRLLAFARRQKLKIELVKLAELIDGMADMLRRSVGPTIRIDIDIEEGLAPIQADANQIELALLNLTINARDAMPDGGRIVIAARNAGRPAGTSASGAANFVQLSVTDDGDGMDEATADRCMEPFFTTKEIGKGTGLGLSSVHGMAVQSGGAIKITSAPGRGTTVDLWFPTSADEGDAESQPAPAAVASDPGRLHVLVVDDEALIGSFTASMLEDLGHTAQWVPSGAEALNIINSAQTIDLVVTDHAMPGMTGGALAQAIHEFRPGMPIILATGFADVPGSYARGLPRLSKPFGPVELATALAALKWPQRPAGGAEKRPSADVSPSRSGQAGP